MLSALWFFFFAAQLSAKKLELDWKPQERAIAYEVEIRKKSPTSGQTSAPKNSTEPPQAWKTKVPRISLDLPEALYSLRIRALRDDGKLGSWSKRIPVDLSPPKIALLQPVENTILRARGKTEKVQFVWKPGSNSSKVQSYKLYVWSLNELPIIETTKETQLTLELEAQRTYMWGVTTTAIQSTGNEATEPSNQNKNEASSAENPSQSPAVSYETLAQRQSFYLEGKMLPKPTLLELNETQARWSAVLDAEEYMLEIERQLLETSQRDGSWHPILRELTSETLFNYSKLPPAKYRLRLQAKSSARPASQTLEKSFTIKPLKIID